MTARFLDPLNLTELTDDGDSTWRLDAPFHYQSDLIGLITVPAGFVTDLASVPRLFFVYDLLGGWANEPAVIHDFLYYTAKVRRPLADNVLFEAMGVIRMPWYRRYPIYWGVRAGGWIEWDKHRANGDPK